jgi:hypothetical protein
MALTRARAVAGDASLCVPKPAALIDEVLATPAGPVQSSCADLTEMRDLIEQEKPPRDIWDVKLIPGGLIDIEFIAQYALASAPAPEAGCPMAVNTGHPKTGHGHAVGSVGRRSGRRPAGLASTLGMHRHRCDAGETLGPNDA